MKYLAIITGVLLTAAAFSYFAYQAEAKSLPFEK